MINPFELIEKYPPKLTLLEKILRIVVVLICVGFIGLAGLGIYFLTTL